VQSKGIIETTMINGKGLTDVSTGKELDESKKVETGVGSAEFQFIAARHCKPVFAAIFNTSQLVKSLDSATFLSADTEKIDSTPWPHVDTSSSDEFVIQGLYCDVDVPTEIGGFVCYEASHKHHPHLMQV
jgi:hypothetical protein